MPTVVGGQDTEMSGDMIGEGKLCVIHGVWDSEGREADLLCYRAEKETGGMDLKKGEKR